MSIVRAEDSVMYRWFCLVRVVRAGGSERELKWKKEGSCQAGEGLVGGLADKAGSSLWKPEQP